MKTIDALDIVSSFLRSENREEYVLCGRSGERHTHLDVMDCGLRGQIQFAEDIVIGTPSSLELAFALAILNPDVFQWEYRRQKGCPFRIVTKSHVVVPQDGFVYFAKRDDFTEVTCSIVASSRKIVPCMAIALDGWETWEYLTKHGLQVVTGKSNSH